MNVGQASCLSPYFFDQFMGSMRELFRRNLSPRERAGVRGKETPQTLTHTKYENRFQQTPNPTRRKMLELKFGSRLIQKTESSPHCPILSTGGVSLHR